VPIQLSEVVPAAPRSWTRPSPTRQARGAPSQARNANRRARLTSGHQAERERREAERVAAAVSRRESHRKLSFEEQARICQRWQRARRVERALEEESTDPAQLGLASWEEEQEALTDGSRARRELWEGYQRMVHGVVRSCIGAPAGRGDYDDMVQVAFEALLSTAEIFDPSRAKSLSTLGLLKMRQAVWRAAHALRLPVHIPVYVLELHARMSRVESALEARLRREPTDAEVARELGTTPEKVRSTRQAMSMQRLLDDLPRRADGDEASAEELVSSTGMDDSSSRYTRDPAEELERAKAARQVQSDVEQLLEVLPPRQAEAIRAKFGIPAPEGGAGLGPSGRREPHRSDLRQGGDADELDEAFNAMFLGRTDDHADAGGQARRLGNSRRRRDARQGVQLLREMVHNSPQLRATLMEALGKADNA